MSDETFSLDTNILVYSVDRRAGHRYEIAKHIMRAASLKSCRLTLQSISEFHAVVTRKRMMPPARAAQVAEDIINVYHTIAATSGAVRTALKSAANGQASYWDALLVATAAEAGCTTILTEDLADGTMMHGVRILNPFGTAELTPAAAALLATD